MVITILVLVLLWGSDGRKLKDVLLMHSLMTNQTSPYAPSITHDIKVISRPHIVKISMKSKPRIWRSAWLPMPKSEFAYRVHQAKQIMMIQVY